MFWLLVCALTLLLRSPTGEAASNFHLRNHTGLLFLYGFTEGQATATIPSHVEDITGRYLLGNLTTSTVGAVSWSSERQGMQVPSRFGGVRAESELDSDLVLSELSSEFTLELFLQSPNNPLDEPILIGGFGDWTPGAAFVSCDASTGGWQIHSTLGANVVFSGVFAVSGVPTCLSLSVSITTNTLRHFLVRVRDGLISVVCHGSTANLPDSNVVFDPSLWARHPAPLAFASPHASSGWTGFVYMAAMYDRYFSNAEVASSRDAGPPNSKPFTSVTSVEAPEDSAVELYP